MTFVLLALLLQSPADALFEKARAAQTAGRLDEAEQAWSAYLKRYPPKAEALANLGALLARRERYAEAVARYKAALKLDPTLAPLHLNLGLAYLKQTQPAEAVREFDLFLKAQPANRQALQLRAMALLESERYSDAESQYRALLPGDATIALGLGTALLRQGKAAEARTVLGPVLTSEAPDIQFVLAQLLQQEGRVDDAMALLAHLDPAMAGVRVALGTGLWRQRKTDEAVAQWRADGTSFEALYLLGSALSMNEVMRAEGESYLRKAVALRPGNARANYALGKLIWQRSKNPEALPYLERATKSDPLFREAFFLHATALQSLGHKAEAARSFARVKELSRRELARQQDLFSESLP